MSESNAEATITASSSAPVVVAKVVPHKLMDVWQALMAPRGAEALLGDGGELGTKGQSWRSDQGHYGVVRSFHPLEQIRFSWHATEGAPATLVDLHLSEHADGTRLELRHDHLNEDLDRDWLATHWADAIAQIDKAVG